MKLRDDRSFLNCRTREKKKETEREGKRERACSDLPAPRNPWHLIDALFHTKGRIIIAVSDTACSSAYTCFWCLWRDRITYCCLPRCGCNVTKTRNAEYFKLLPIIGAKYRCKMKDMRWVSQKSRSVGSSIFARFHVIEFRIHLREVKFYRI